MIAVPRTALHGARDVDVLGSFPLSLSPIGWSQVPCSSPREEVSEVLSVRENDSEFIARNSAFYRPN